MSENSKSTGMVIDGVFASECIDSSGEIVEIEGMDTTTFDDGFGVANYEHLSPGAKKNDESKPSHGQEIVGSVIFTKKIFKESDCENERQRKYWNLTNKTPYLYGMVRLYDGAGHDSARALAAQIRDHAANGQKIVVRYSIEGSTLGRSPDETNRITNSCAKRVALTLTPCNKTAWSGLIADPMAPEGWNQNPEKAGKKDLLEGITKFEDPSMHKIGGSFALESDDLVVEDPIAKTLSAGSYNAAPGSLTGGAALQREDRGTIKNSMLAAVRDYGKKKFSKTEFRAFAKARLPDASDEFVDHFTDLAEDYTAKLHKAEEDGPGEDKATKLKPMVKSGQPVLSHRGNPLFTTGNEQDAAQFEQKHMNTKTGPRPVYNLYRGTVRGKLLKPNDGIKGMVIDEKKGIAHFPFGSVKLYNPDADLPQHANAFNEVLNDPKVSEFHDQAMENWVRAHKLHKAGKTPPEVLMHSVLLSQLSPNTPVPIQELMYGKLIDSMNATGADPREPGFADKVGQHWLASGNNGQLPEHSKEWYAQNKGVHVGKELGGTVAKFMLANNKLGNMDKYHQLHGYMTDLLQQHKGDARSVATQMMADKSSAKGREIPGLSNKTSRYTLGMTGGGNVVVPDTHFIRHILGLESVVDSSTLAQGARDQLWNPANAHELESLDKWYAKNHPAVKHMLNHPKWGKHFETPEDAIFPAFWKHWIAIAPHEKARGMISRFAANEGTTHQPFWDAINPYLLHKSEGHDPSLPGKTAAIHAEYIKHYGEVPAMMLFYHHLAPKLLDAAEARESVNKPTAFLKSLQLDNLFIELKKALQDTKPLDPMKIFTVHLTESGHPCGRFAIFDNHISVLEDYTGLLSKFIKNGPVNDSTVAIIHGLKSSPHMTVSEEEISLAPPEEANGEAGPSFHQEGSLFNASADTQMPVEDEASLPDSVFQYKRIGMDKPHILECINKQYTLDGNRASKEVMDEIMDEVKRGVATIRYHRPEAMTKAENEEDFSNPQTLLQHIRAAVAAGTLRPEVERGLVRKMYEDHMTPGMGNKAAADEFKAKKKPGVHISMDGNSFKTINDTFGHSVGDQAITAFGKAMREAMDESVGRGKGKLFRNPDEHDIFRSGGDEFYAHVPSHEHAAQFARALHTKLEAIPPIQGVHKLSMAMGFGNDYDSADHALGEAKKQRIHPETGQRMFKPGQEPNMAHSNVPGNEGPVPLHADHVEMPPPASKPVEQAAPQVQAPKPLTPTGASA